ncbi:hypothetical protein [Winogradskyella sp.]|uniref:hypothetical protein n=1 Tax=Winogradskyella sp. TaxID=1883156 RepID=UPI0026113308|nr:hypothetical protein [Winogradskyella sp.]
MGDLFKVGLGIAFVAFVASSASRSKKKDTPVYPEGDPRESFLGMDEYPRGIRNNNPGNIKYSASNNWLGKIPLSENTDGTFEQFETFAYGTRAMLLLLTNYINSGRDTLGLIVDDWDLGNPSYLTYLIDETGFAANQPLQADKATLKAIARPMVIFENGIDMLTDARFETAYDML